MPERDIGSLGVMEFGLEAAGKFFCRRRRRRRHRRPPKLGVWQLPNPLFCDTHENYGYSGGGIL